jgi:hypothetical protein
MLPSPVSPRDPCVVVRQCETPQVTLF